MEIGRQPEFSPEVREGERYFEHVATQDAYDAVDSLRRQIVPLLSFSEDQLWSDWPKAALVLAMGAGAALTPGLRNAAPAAEWLGCIALLAIAAAKIADRFAGTEVWKFSGYLSELARGLETQWGGEEQERTRG